MTTTLIDLIRHGEPLGGRKYRGRTNDPLSETGWQQMRAAVGTADTWQRIVSSPLERCRAFAEQLSAERKLPLEIEPRFMEIGFGVWEGRTPAEIEAETPGLLDRFRRDPVACRPDGGETLEALAARTRSGWEDLLSRHAGCQVLLVAHGAVIRSLIGHALGLPPASLFRLEVRYASRTRLKVEPDGFATLLTHGV